MLCVPCSAANREDFAELKSRAHIYIYVASHDMNISKHTNAPSQIPQPPSVIYVSQGTRLPYTHQ